MMDRIAIWPFATPMDSSGNMVDVFQGIYSRGLCRAVAEGLLRTKVCEVAVCLPVVTIGNVTSWSVMGKTWTFTEALEVQLPDGTDFLTWGTMVITERVELHVLLISRSQRRLLVDRQFNYPRARIPVCFSEIVAVLAGAIAGRPLTDEENRRVQLWGTNSSDAYLAYLEAWSAAAAFRFGVSVPNPQAALECALKAVCLDPTFAEAGRLREELNSLGPENPGDQANELIGYSEFAYPMTIPDRRVVS
jgi:hypothetical protein